MNGSAPDLRISLNSANQWLGNNFSKVDFQFTFQLPLLPCAYATAYAVQKTSVSAACLHLFANPNPKASDQMPCQSGGHCRGANCHHLWDSEDGLGRGWKAFVFFKWVVLCYIPLFLYVVLIRFYADGCTKSRSKPTLESCALQRGRQPISYGLRHFWRPFEFHRIAHLHLKNVSNQRYNNADNTHKKHLESCPTTDGFEPLA